MADAWTRPYSPGTGRWIVLGWEAASLAVLGWTTARLFDLTGRSAWIMVGVLAAVWLLGCWRILRMGVYVSSRGVRIRGLLRDRTLHWHHIRHIWLHEAKHRLGPVEIPSGLTVLIERSDGSVVNTELWAQGVDFHSRPSVFRAVYHDLRRRHHAATALPRPA
jgi:hypothetical protein